MGRDFTERSGDALGHVLGGGSVGVQKEQSEFVTAEACGQIAGPAVDTKRGGDALKGMIAREMSHSVVNSLEIIQVKQNKSETGRRAFGSQHFMLEGVEEGAVVCESGKAVMGGLVASLFFCSTLFCGIEGQANAADDKVCRIAQWLNGHIESAILALQFELG